MKDRFAALARLVFKALVMTAFVKFAAPALELDVLKENGV
jgi:hypothetical protein